MLPYLPSVCVRSLNGQCVFLKALKSSRSEDCDIAKLRRGGAAALSPEHWYNQYLSLPESSRQFRKPFREAVGFLDGDVMSVVGTRTQLSNVPTKILFSHLSDPDEKRPKQNKGRAAAASSSYAKAQAAKVEAHIAIFIDWKKRRTWVNTYADGTW